MKFFRYSLLLAVLLTLSACTFSLAEDITPPPGADQMTAPEPQAQAISGPVFPVVPPDPAQGAAIFIEKCAPCHGDTGMGDGPSAASLSVPVAALGDPQLARQRTPAEWFTTVTQGNIERFMPPFTSLTDRQRWDVVAYAFMLSETPETIAQGQSLYQANCAACHGDQGKGDGPDAAGLTTAPGDFTDQEQMTEKSGLQLAQAIRQGVGEAMPGYAEQLSEAEVWALAAYVRNLGFVASSEMAAAEPPLPEATPANPQEATQMAQAGNPLGVVTVSIKDSAGQTLKLDMPVTLYAFDNMQFVYSTTQSTQIEGTYTFEGVEMPAGRAFISSVDYSGVTYGSDVASVSDASAPLPLDITVFETTTDASKLVVDRLHIFFDFSIPENVQVIELYIIQNQSEYTVVAENDGGAVVNFHLPKDVTNLQFQDGEIGGRYLQTEDGFADTQAVRAGAGDTQVVFAYSLPFKRKLKFSQLQEMPINSAVILVPEGVKLKGDNLQDGGLKDVQGASYQMYTLQSIPAGGDVSVEISGSPKGAAASIGAIDTRTGLLIGLGALGVALIVAGVWIYRRDRAANITDEDEAEAEEEEEAMPEANPEQLMDAIIALDDGYQAGELPEEAYRQRRAELKARLDKQLNDAE